MQKETKPTVQDIFPDIKPAHTQGEWKLAGSGAKPNTRIICRGDHIADTFAFDVKQVEAEANAQRIVRAVNMHEKLVNGLKSALNLFARGYEPKEGAEDTIGSKLYVELSELLKQAEQK